MTDLDPGEQICVGIDAAVLAVTPSSRRTRRAIGPSMWRRRTNGRV